MHTAHGMQKLLVALQVVALAEYRAQLFDYLRSRMSAIAPNLTVSPPETPLGPPCFCASVARTLWAPAAAVCHAEGMPATACLLHMRRADVLHTSAPSLQPAC